MIDPRSPDFDSPPFGPGRATFGYAPAAATEPLVSIITPFYNDGPEFLDTAACVLGQSFQAFEWIIINDASTSAESLALLERYRNSPDPRIRIIDQPENHGPGAARNAGIRAARAPYVFQLDSDDLVEPTAIEKCLLFLCTHPECSFVKGFTVGFGAKQHLYDKGFHLREKFLQHNCATITTMIRREDFLAVGGYDESIRGGMEDWDFWLRCAAAGKWGDTIREYLDWYRRRPSHNDVWHDWDGADRQQAFHARAVEKYSFLKGNWPRIHPAPRTPLAPIRHEALYANPLAKRSPRLLAVFPWMRMGGADKFNLDLVSQLTSRGWQVTIATTTGSINGWMPLFARHTPDIFVLPSLVRFEDMPAALRTLIDSRDPDVVLLSNSESAYELLPFLRAACPRPAYVDYNHMEEEHWKGGGHPRSGVGAQSLLELSITASSHLRDWMISRGGDPSRIEVATINVDPAQWKPDPSLRARVRAELNLADDEPILLYAGRICAQKQPLVFAATIDHLRRTTPRFTALVAGDGEDRPSLEKALAASGASPNVRMLGEVTSDRMRELMAAADIFFLPSQWEGIALVLYEAMAAGAVFVGADVGGQRELATPECACLLPKAPNGREIELEAPAYAEVLAKLIADPARRASMAAAARRRIEQHFRLDQMGDRMDALLRRAIDARTAAPRPTPPLELGIELAVRAVESQRLTRASDRLWQENRRLREELGLARSRPALVEVKTNGHAAAHPPIVEFPSAPRLNGRHGRKAHANGTRPNGAHRPAESPEQRVERVAARELARIQSSRSWRMLMFVKRTPPYRLVARLRFGPGWEARAQGGSARLRLARLRRSRAYRLVQAVKSLPPARWYASRKYGPEHLDIVQRREELARQVSRRPTRIS